MQSDRGKPGAELDEAYRAEIPFHPATSSTFIRGVHHRDAKQATEAGRQKQKVKPTVNGLTTEHHGGSGAARPFDQVPFDFQRAK
jgi:hypothetical protein